MTSWFLWWPSVVSLLCFQPKTSLSRDRCQGKAEQAKTHASHTRSFPLKSWVVCTGYCVPGIHIPIHTHGNAFLQSVNKSITNMHAYIQTKKHVNMYKHLSSCTYPCRNVIWIQCYIQTYLTEQMQVIMIVSVYILNKYILRFIKHLSLCVYELVCIRNSVGWTLVFKVNNYKITPIKK